PYEGKLRVTVEHRTAAEIAEMLRLAEAEEQARKKNEPAPKPPPKAALALPAGAAELEQDEKHLEFKIGAGKAKAVVDAWRKKLRDDGWKEETATIQPMFGNLSFKKEDGDLTITYVDTGLMPAQVMVMAIGATVETA